MRSANSFRFGALLIVALTLLPCAQGRSQDTQTEQSQSVADAARRARDQKKEQKKKIAKSASKVITDDDLDTKNFKPGAEGLNVGSSPKSDTEPPRAAAVASAEAADKRAAAVATDSGRKPGEDPESAKLKERIAQVQRDLDLLQRAFSLDQDSFYSRPDYSRDTAGKAKLDSERRQIDEKQKELDELKTRLAALTELQDRKKSQP
jgi:hypothetical protein